MKTITYQILTACILLLSFCTAKTYGQAELEPWGNLSGIRLDGQLMEFETNLTVVGKDWSDVRSTAKERQRPAYTRDGNKQMVSTRIDSLYLAETVTDSAEGVARVTVTVTSHADADMTGIYFGVRIPEPGYPNARLQYEDSGLVRNNYQNGQHYL